MMDSTGRLPARLGLLVLTLLQLPLIEVGNAVRADCYSIASYPSTCLHGDVGESSAVPCTNA